MLSWLADHTDPLNLLVNVGMLLVWLFYFELLLSNYRNQKRPKILVNRGAGTGWESHCLITNMSEKVVYVSAVIVRVGVGERHWQSVITDRRGLEDDSSAASNRERIGQGPLGAGEMIDLGSIRQLIELAAPSEGDEHPDLDPARIDSVEIKIAALYDSEDIVIGASRSFEVLDDGRLRPDEVYTRQIRRRRERKALADDVLGQLTN